MVDKFLGPAVELADQSLPPPIDFFCTFRIIDEVVKLLPVGLEIEKLFGVLDRISDELTLPVGEVLHRLGFRIEQ